MLVMQQPRLQNSVDLDDIGIIDETDIVSRLLTERTITNNYYTRQQILSMYSFLMNGIEDDIGTVNMMNELRNAVG